MISKTDAITNWGVGVRAGRVWWRYPSCEVIQENNAEYRRYLAISSYMYLKLTISNEMMPVSEAQSAI